MVLRPCHAKIGTFTAHQDGRLVWLSYNPDGAPSGTSPLEFSPTANTGCAVRIYYDEYYRVSETHAERKVHIQNVMEFVNITYHKQLMNIYLESVTGPKILSGITETNADWNAALDKMEEHSVHDNVCVVMWLSGRLYRDNNVGLAYVGAACSKCHNRGGPSLGFSSLGSLVQSGHTTLEAMYIESVVIAHEMGHLMGANHWDKGAPSIMKSYIPDNLDPENMLEFSDAAMEDINNYMKTCNDDTCLTPIPASESGTPTFEPTERPASASNPFFVVDTTFHVQLAFILGGTGLLSGTTLVMLLWQFSSADRRSSKPSRNAPSAGRPMEFVYLSQQ